MTSYIIMLFRLFYMKLHRVVNKFVRHFIPRNKYFEGMKFGCLLIRVKMTTTK